MFVSRIFTMLKIPVLFWMVLNCHSVLSDNVTVELAIFCDFEFSEVFEFNETKIREYWAIRVFDADLRFKTLPSVDVKFVVTSLTVIKKKTDQPFIEQVRELNGQVSIERVHQKFSVWLYTYKGTKFDVALLSMGAVNNNSKFNRTIGYMAGACRTSDSNGNLAAIVVNLDRRDLWNGCGSIEFALSTVLGSWDNDRYSDEDCVSQKYIISKECSQNHYFFSSCSNGAISEHIKQSGSCLQRIDVPEASVFNTSDLTVRPPSIMEQCAIIAKNSNVWINQSDENRCFSIKCYLDLRQNRTFLKTMYPVDNSPCDSEKSCFRGRCIFNGFQLMNVASSKCLHSSNRFASNDTLQMRICYELPTPLDMFMFLDNGDQGIFLATPYSSINGSENSDKCLASTSFGNCYESENQQNFGWDLIRVENSCDEIMLQHKLSQLCLYTRGYYVQLIRCDYEDISFRWKLKKLNSNDKLPRHLFQSMSSLLESETTAQITLLEERIHTSSINEAKIVDSCNYWVVYIVIFGSTVLSASLIMVIYKQRKLLRLRNAERVLIHFNDIQYTE